MRGWDVGTGTADLKAAPAAKGRRSGAGANIEPPTIDSLPELSQQQLDELFSGSPAGPTPSGVAEGVAIIAPGTPIATALQPLLRLSWQGKVFYPKRSDLLNRVGPFGILLARAQVYRDASWVDGREAIILDYSMASLPFRAIRDEVREVAPGLYLGVVFWIGTKTINFALQF
jgi:hypothetical protein